MTNSTHNGDSSSSNDWSLYPYDPSKVLPIIFACAVLVSGVVHLYQGFFHYRYKRFGGFMVWGSSVWVSGFVLREISAYLDQDVNIYIAQFVMILAGPPIYAAAEYFVLGRLLYYLPYYAPLHPGRATSTFVILGVLVENLSAAGAARLANSTMDSSDRKVGANLLEASLLLQACVEFLYLSIVATVFIRCRRSGVMPPHVRTVLCLLCFTSTLILIRCIFRTVEAFQAYTCHNYYCGPIAHNEWYLWVFEVAVMVIYVYALNIFHPGRYLPADNRQYLDLDGVTERMGPGWEDNRSFIMTVIDPFGLSLTRKKMEGAGKFWEQENPIVESSCGARRTKESSSPDSDSKV